MGKIKTLILFTFLTITIPEAWCNDGDKFSATIAEGIDMIFTVLSETDKTCQVGSGQAFEPAISTSYLGSVTIPNSVNGYSVISIDKDAFMGCDKLTSISLPNSITKIGDQAFYGCVSLENINIPNQIKDIGRYAFQSCGIKEIKIPASIRIIKEATFFNCQKLESITLPSSLYAIDKSAFSGCI